jgi:hypothetical protein
MSSGFPFHRVEGETAAAWAACLTYCVLPPDIRSVKRAQEEFYKNSPLPSRKAGSASRGWEQWSAKFKWTERACLLDTQKALEFMEAEKDSWMKTQDDFNKISQTKQQHQTIMETYFTYWLEENKNRLDSRMKKENGDPLNDPRAVLSLIKEMNQIFKISCESDRILWDRYLTSIGIATVLAEQR